MMADRALEVRSSDCCKVGVDFQDDAILVRLGIDRRNDALAEGIIKHVVDGRRRDAETARGGAVDDEIDGQTLLLQIARHIGDLRQLA